MVGDDDEAEQEKKHNNGKEIYSSIQSLRKMDPRRKGAIIHRRK